MQQQIYPYSRQYKRQVTGTRDAIPVRAMPDEMPQTVVPKVHTKRAGIGLFIICLVMAIAAALALPMVLQGQTAAATPTGLGSAASGYTEAVSYGSIGDAVAAVGFEAKFPAMLQESATLTQVQVLDGSVLEAQYSTSKGTVIYRTAVGNDDISGVSTSYAYSSTETSGEIARTYSGVTANVLSLAVWAHDGYTYAIIADSIDSETMHAIAESVQ